jgi:N-acetylneuraminic acid mutarotase
MICARRAKECRPDVARGKESAVISVFKAAIHSRRSRAVAVTAAALAVTAAPAAAALRNATYTGKTSQGRRASLVVAGGKVKRFSITWNAPCKAQHTALDGLKTFSSNVTVGHKGRWQTTGHYSAPSGNGYTEQFTVSDGGLIVNRKSVRGTFHGTVQVYRSSSKQHVGSCASGKISFTLKPKA